METEVAKTLDTFYGQIPFLALDAVTAILFRHSSGPASFPGLLMELKYVIQGEYSPLEVELGDALLLGRDIHEGKDYV